MVSPPLQADCLTVPRFDTATDRQHVAPWRGLELTSCSCRALTSGATGGQASIWAHMHLSWVAAP